MISSYSLAVSVTGALLYTAYAMGFRDGFRNAQQRHGTVNREAVKDGS